MKKRMFAALLALALALGLVAPAGVVITAEAAVSLSDAQYYLDILNQTNLTDSYLVDFDGDGRDELVTVKITFEDSPVGPLVQDIICRVYQGQNNLAVEGGLSEGNDWPVGIYTKDGKHYLLVDEDPIMWGIPVFYTVQNGQWVKTIQFSVAPDYNEGSDGSAIYFINDQKVSEEKYNAEWNSYQKVFDFDSSHGDVRSELEATIQAEALKNASPEEILAQIPYYGDRSKCRMTSEQAEAYAEKLANWEFKEGEPRSDDDPFYYDYIRPCLCDLEGNGNPALMVDYSIVSDDPGWDWAGEYNANIYGWNNGQVAMIGEICWDRTYGTASSEVYTSFGKNRFGGYGWSAWRREMAGAWQYNDVYYLKNGELQHSLCEEIYDFDTDMTTVSLDGVVKGTFPGDASYDEISALVQSLIEQAGGPVAAGGGGESTVTNMTVASAISALRAYADAKKFPTYTYAQVEAGDAHYSDVAAAVAGQGTVQAVYKLLEDTYYVLLESQGSYTGAVVRGLLEDGRPVWKVTQSDLEPAEEGVLNQLVDRLVTKANLELDFSRLQGTPSLEELTDYLRELLKNIDGLTPNDAAKSDLAAFVDGAAAALASGSVSGKNNRLTLTEDALSSLVEQARQAADSLTGELRAAGVELNKSLVPKIRVLWGDLDGESACQLTFSRELAQALEGCDLQVLLGNGQTWLELSAGDLQALTGELGQLSVQFQREAEGVYAIRFLDGGDQVVEQLSRPVTVGLPAPGGLATIMASYAGGSDNWGGQYDPSAGVITFDTVYSGRYEVLENNVAIDDIGELSEESRQAISFMVSRGYMSAEDGLFRPGDSLNRYEFTEALVGMFFALDRSLTASFPDVPADSPYYPYVASAQAKSIISGFEDGTFGGEDNITREQVFALAARTLMDQKGYAQPAELDSYLSGFADREEISDWAAAQVALSVREGVASRGSVLLPQTDITREQAAVVLYRLFQLLYEVPPVALDVPEAAGGASTPVLIGICAVVAALSAGGAAVLLLKKPKAASGKTSL